MSYALQTLWHERTRYAAAVGAVAFSAVLIVLQVGLLLGLFEITSIPIDHTTADVWVGSKDLLGVDLAEPIPISFVSRLDKPGVRMPELYYLTFGNWTKPKGGKNLCVIVGSALEESSSGRADVLTPELRAALSEPMTVVIDQSEVGRLGLSGIGDRGKINNKEVRVVGSVAGIKSLAAPWIFCSHTTARELISVTTQPDQTTYLLAKCESKERAQEVVAELKREYPDMSSFTSEEFSTTTRVYWLTRTKAGIAIGYAALLGLLVGALITAQTLYSATMASAKEFATLLALGIPRRRIYTMVFAQSFWVGVIGVLMAYPIVYVLGYGAERAGARVPLHWQLLAAAAAITMTTAMLAGLYALRSVRKIEPMGLLR